MAISIFEVSGRDNPSSLLEILPRELPRRRYPTDRLVPVTSSMIATKDGVIFIICCGNSHRPNETEVSYPTESRCSK